METNNKNISGGAGIKRRSTFAIMFYINRTKIRKDGTCQVLCRVSIDSESEQIGTKMFISPSRWSTGEGRAKGRSAEAMKVNQTIGDLTDEIKAHHQRIKESLGFVTAEFVKNAVKGIAQKPVTLIKLFEEHNEEFKKRVGIDRIKATYEAYVLTCKHLRSFLAKKYQVDDVPLKSLNQNFYDDFDFYLRVDRTMKQKTIHQHLYNLKKMTTRAYHQGTLRRDPFMNFHPELPPLKSRHLLLEDLKRLMAVKIDRPNLQRVRDHFVFATFTSLPYADLKRLSEEHIKPTEDGRLMIIIKRQKTGNEIKCPIEEIPMKIMEKYKNERVNGRIFKVYTRNYMYKLIKKVGELCGIDDVTFHKARHNFGTHIGASMGLPIETIKEIMGHMNITTTQIYAKVTDKKVDEDMKKLAARTAAKKISLFEDEELRAKIRYPSRRKNNTSLTANNGQ